MKHAQHDTSKKTNRIIWFYFIILAVSLYAMIAMLGVFFDISVSNEKKTKIGLLESDALIKLREYEKEILDGIKAVEGSSNNIAIEEAIEKYLSIMKG